MAENKNGLDGLIPFDYSKMRGMTKEESEVHARAIQKISKPTGRYLDWETMTYKDKKWDELKEFLTDKISSIDDISTKEHLEEVMKKVKEIEEKYEFKGE